MQVEEIVCQIKKLLATLPEIQSVDTLDYSGIDVPVGAEHPFKLTPRECKVEFKFVFKRVKED